MGNKISILQAMMGTTIMIPVLQAMMDWRTMSQMNAKTIPSQGKGYKHFWILQKICCPMFYSRKENTFNEDLLIGNIT